MQTIVTDVRGGCLSATRVNSASLRKNGSTDQGPGGPGNIVLDRVRPDPPTTRGERFVADYAKLLWPLVLLRKQNRCDFPVFTTSSPVSGKKT